MPHTDVIPTSASIASTGLGIRYIGKHVYAYSGAYAASTSAVTVLDFTSGSAYIVGQATLNSAIQYNTANIAGTFMRIKLNGAEVAITFSGNGANDSPSSSVIDLLLPPLTHVEIDLWSDNNAGSNTTNILFAGRVYGAE